MHTKAVHLRMDFSHGPPPGFIYNPHGQTHMGPGASEQIFAESGESLLDAYVASLQDFKEFLRGDVNKPKRKMVTTAPNRFVDYWPKAQERIVPALEGNKTISERVIGKWLLLWGEDSLLSIYFSCGDLVFRFFWLPSCSFGWWKTFLMPLFRIKGWIQEMSFPPRDRRFFLTFPILSWWKQQACWASVDRRVLPVSKKRLNLLSHLPAWRMGLIQLQGCRFLRCRVVLENRMDLG